MSSISAYHSGRLTAKNLAVQVKRLSDAFPDLDMNFHRVLAERIKSNGFTDKRLKAAVDNLIDTFKYPRPTVADIISFDRRIRTYTYKQVQDAHNNGEAWDTFAYVPEHKFWVERRDAERYGLTIKK